MLKIVFKTVFHPTVLLESAWETVATGDKEGFFCPWLELQTLLFPRSWLASTTFTSVGGCVLALAALTNNIALQVEECSWLRYTWDLPHRHAFVLSMLGSVQR